MSAPPKGSDQHKANEKIIQNTPELRQLREQAGLRKDGSSTNGSWAGGKGSSRRGNDEAYKRGYDQIDWSKK